MKAPTTCAQNRERADWVRNIQVNPIVAFWVNGRKLTGMAEIVALGDGDAEKVKQLFDAIHEWSDGLLVRLTPDSDNVTPSEGHGQWLIRRHPTWTD